MPKSELDVHLVLSAHAASDFRKFLERACEAGLDLEDAALAPGQETAERLVEEMGHQLYRRGER